MHSEPDPCLTPKQTLCQGCSLLCEDLPTEQSSDPNFCSKGANWLSHQVASASEIHAIARLKTQLQAMLSPILIAGSGLSIEAQMGALQWLKSTNGDFLLAHENSPAEPQGMYCTLGEMKQRSQLVFLWDLDPAISQERLHERFIKTGKQKPKLWQLFSNAISKKQPSLSQQCYVNQSVADQLTILSHLTLLCQGNNLPHSNAENRLSEIAIEINNALQATNYPVVVLSEQAHPAILAAWKQLSFLLHKTCRLHLIVMESQLGRSWSYVQQSLFQQTGSCRFSSQGVQFDTARFTISSLLRKNSHSPIVVAGDLHPSCNIDFSTAQTTNQVISISAQQCNALFPSIHETLKQLVATQTYFRADHVPISFPLNPSSGNAPQVT